MVKIKKDQTRIYDNEGYRKRAACICFKSDSEEQVLLVSSSRWPERWVVPGGGVEPDEIPGDAAVREVTEEAGVTGRLKRCLGVFQNSQRKHRTAVYVLIVTQTLDEWEDSKNINRLREWFKFDEAIRHLGSHKPVQRDYLCHAQMTRQSDAKPNRPVTMVTNPVNDGIRCDNCGHQHQLALMKYRRDSDDIFSCVLEGHEDPSSLTPPPPGPLLPPDSCVLSEVTVGRAVLSGVSAPPSLADAPPNQGNGIHPVSDGAHSKPNSNSDFDTRATTGACGGGKNGSEQGRSVDQDDGKGLEDGVHSPLSPGVTPLANTAPSESAVRTCNKRKAVYEDSVTDTNAKQSDRHSNDHGCAGSALRNLVCCTAGNTDEGVNTGEPPAGEGQNQSGSHLDKVIKS